MQRLQKEFNWKRRFVSDSIIYTMGNCSMRVFSKGLTKDKRRGLAVIYTYDNRGIILSSMRWLNRKEAIIVYKQWKSFDKQQARELTKFKH